MSTTIALVISCEHAVDTVPERYQELFIPYQSLLHSHRGVDFGALAIAEHLSTHVPCDFIHATTTRLLVDCNRSVFRRKCFSEVTKNLPLSEQKTILEHYYLPFRQKVNDCIKRHVKQGAQVWHMSIHSFTPVMNGVVRTADIGLLYDPKRDTEKNLAKKWQHAIQQRKPEYRVRMNYPYQGISDGFTSALRKIYTDHQYIGIEIESNQALTSDAHNINTIKNILSSSLLSLC